MEQQRELQGPEHIGRVTYFNERNGVGVVQTDILTGSPAGLTFRVEDPELRSALARRFNLDVVFQMLPGRARVIRLAPKDGK